MTSTEIAVRQAVQLSTDQLQYISKTEFVPPGLRGNLPAILACVATGRELGIGDMVSLKSIHIIDGKATFSAELMVQLVRRKGHSIIGEVSDGSATVTGTRIDNGDEMTCTWTTAMADRAGLLGKANWKKYPEAMLWARAASQLCRMLFADCFAGATYTPEELEDGVSPEAQSFIGQGFDDAAPPPPSPQVETEEPPAPALITSAQAKKLNVLVGQLRTGGHITTKQLWDSFGRTYEYGSDGELHWATLRESLTKQEASDLIERLEKFQSTTLAAIETAAAPV